MVAVSAAAAPSFASGAASPQAAEGAAAQIITLRGRPGIDGPWRTVLRLRLRRGGVPISFSVCAVLGSKNVPPSCHAAAGARLPNAARLRLEQRRKANAPWKVVGVSFSPFLDARLSNDVSGNRFGTVSYRVTMRGPNGTILRTSNPFKVIWHR
jgi:hypothetical protein